MPLHPSLAMFWPHVRKSLMVLGALFLVPSLRPPDHQQKTSMQWRHTIELQGGPVRVPPHHPANLYRCTPHETTKLISLQLTWCALSLGKLGKGFKDSHQMFIDVDWLLSLFHIKTWSVVQQAEVCSIPLGNLKGVAMVAMLFFRSWKYDVSSIFCCYILLFFTMLLVVCIGTGFLRGVGVYLCFGVFLSSPFKGWLVGSWEAKEEQNTHTHRHIKGLVEQASHSKLTLGRCRSTGVSQVHCRLLHYSGPLCLEEGSPRPCVKPQQRD